MVKKCDKCGREFKRNGIVFHKCIPKAMDSYETKNPIAMDRIADSEKEIAMIPIENSYGEKNQDASTYEKLSKIAMDDETDNDEPMDSYGEKAMDSYEKESNKGIIAFLIILIVGIGLFLKWKFTKIEGENNEGNN